jgi:hypothetical protein
MAYYTTTGKRQLLISPYTPDRTELIGTNAKQASSVDIGKPVKLSGNTVVPCADGDEIYGFIASVEAGSKDGYSVGGVVCDVGREVWATDESGSLAVGNLVTAGTVAALGTEGVGNVKIRAATSLEGQSSILTSGALAIKAGASAVVKTVNTVTALVGGALVSKAAADMAALAGTVAHAKFNVYAFFVSDAGTLTTVMGTPGDTLAAVIMPKANSTKAMIGFVIINPTGTGGFVGGTTALDDATVIPNAVYVNTVGPVGQADQIIGTNLWQVIGLEVEPSTSGHQVLLRKV